MHACSLALTLTTLSQSYFDNVAVFTDDEDDELVEDCSKEEEDAAAGDDDDEDPLPIIEDEGVGFVPEAGETFDDVSDGKAEDLQEEEAASAAADSARQAIEAAAV